MAIINGFLFSALPIGVGGSGSPLAFSPYLYPDYLAYTPKVHVYIHLLF